MVCFQECGDSIKIDKIIKYFSMVQISHFINDKGKKCVKDMYRKNKILNELYL